MLEQWSQEVLSYIGQYINHSPVLYVYLAGLIFLCFRGKDKRRMIVYPSLILMAVILNPICYGYVWAKLITYAFWRMLWMIPVVPVIACTLSELARVIGKAWSTPIVTVLFLVVMFACGDNIYQKDGMYVAAENAYKLPEISVQVGEKLLELEDEPVVVAPSSLYCYLRQYSGKIRLVYGRDADGFIYKNQEEYHDAYELADLVKANDGDTTQLVALARGRDANLIVLPNNHGFEGLEELGFAKAAEVGEMVIYQWNDA